MDVNQSLEVKYLLANRKQPDSLILAMEVFADRYNIPILDKLSSDFLEILIRQKLPKRVLEIGTAIAYSTIRIAGNLSLGSMVDTIEKSRDNVALASTNIQISGLSQKINLIEGDALEILPELDHKYDIIFLDADKEDYLKLFELSKDKLNSEGLYIVDNLFWHGSIVSDVVPEKYARGSAFIQQFNKMFLNHPEFKSTILSVGDGLGLGVKI